MRLAGLRALRLPALRALACGAAFTFASSIGTRAHAAEDPSWFIPEGPRVHNAALEVNPLSFAIGRYSLTLEYVFAPHHAIEISPHIVWAMPGRDDEVDGVGVELGYRYYTGKNGPEGWFAGASFLVGGYRYKHGGTPYVTADHRLLDQDQSVGYQSFGAAIDAGYQLLLWERLVVGAGAGIQYNAFTTQPIFETISHAHQDLLYGSGLRPRVLLATGGAF